MIAAEPKQIRKMVKCKTCMRQTRHKGKVHSVCGYSGARCSSKPIFCDMHIEKIDMKPTNIDPRFSKKYTVSKHGARVMGEDWVSSVVGKKAKPKGTDWIKASGANKKPRVKKGTKSTAGLPEIIII